MKKEIADKWVAALRSGKFEQAKEALKKGDGYCCLGVLCTLTPEEVGKFEGAKYYYNRKRFDEDEFGNSVEQPPYRVSEDGELPESVQEWSGIKSSDGSINSIRKNLVGLNDTDEASFCEIADIIEEHYKEL